jgi:hypothetical protein
MMVHSTSDRVVPNAKHPRASFHWHDSGIPMLVLLRGTFPVCMMTAINGTACIL